MKRIISLSLIVFFCLAGCVYAEDTIVAIVNNDVITQKDLTDFVNFMTMQLSRQYKGKALEDKINSLRSDLLNRLIEDKLILQEAKKEKIAADESRVKAKLDEIRKGYNSDAVFQAELMKQGVTQADIENKIRDQFVMFVVIERQVRSKITVKPDEVTEFYEKNKSSFTSGEAREFEAYALDNEDLAQSFSYNLRTGKKPEDLATRYPYTVNSFTSNREEDLKSEISKVVYKLGINEVSAPVEIDGKFYVFRLVNIIPPQEFNLSQSQGRIHSFLFEKKMQEEFNKWLDGLKKQSYISIK